LGTRTEARSTLVTMCYRLPPPYTGRRPLRLTIRTGTRTPNSVLRTPSSGRYRSVYSRWLATTFDSTCLRNPLGVSLMSVPLRERVPATNCYHAREPLRRAEPRPNALQRVTGAHSNS
jgi:hypothetical protein